MLFGARVAYTVHAGYLSVGVPPVSTPRGRELLVARVMQSVAGRFMAGPHPASSYETAVALHCPETEVDSALLRLQEAGLVHSLAEGGWVPSRPPEQITWAEVRTAARHGQEASSPAPDLLSLKRLWDDADTAASRVLETTVADMVKTTREAQEIDHSGA